MKLIQGNLALKAVITLSASSAIIATANAQDKTVKGEIYWTFDDGPIDASITVMNIMKEHDVKATFFLNGFHLQGEGDENEDLAPQALRQMIDDGHLIANHGINHMLHNCCFGDECGAKTCNEMGIQHATINTYQNVEVEYATFEENTRVVRQFLNMTDGDTIYPNDAMESISRLPYTSTWRVDGLDTDCACCTSDDVNRWDPAFDCTAEKPTNSSLLASEVADLLAADGHEIYGYDINWQPEDFTAPDASVTLADAELLAERIREKAKSTSCPNSNKNTHIVHECDPKVHYGKVVILTHEYFFENNRRGQGLLNIPKFEKVLNILAEEGYVSKTLDQYFENFYPIPEDATTTMVDHQEEEEDQEDVAASGDVSGAGLAEDIMNADDSAAPASAFARMSIFATISMGIFSLFF